MIGITAAFYDGRRRSLAFASGSRGSSQPAYFGAAGALVVVFAMLVGASLWGAIASVQAWAARPAGAAGGLSLILAGAGAAYWAFRKRLYPEFPARAHVERVIVITLAAGSFIAVLTTLAIAFSLIAQSVRFFGHVGVVEFLFGLQWSPQTALRADQIGQSGAFGVLPLIGGTLLITSIALLVGAPLGVFSAIYLSEYAKPRLRDIAKPALEILAGIPTVVYGFFALLFIGPAIRHFAAWLNDAFFTHVGLALPVTAQSALAAGLVMGVMIIPLISSLSDDIINATPKSLRDGALAIGATPSEMIRFVLLPAAAPGLFGAMLLAVSRAIGETMIVVMAAGLAARLTVNPFQDVTTITVQIVTLLTGDQEFDSAKTLSAFALGLVLFTLTLIFNVFAMRAVKRYQGAYE